MTWSKQLHQRRRFSAALPSGARATASVLLCLALVGGCSKDTSGDRQQGGAATQGGAAGNGSSGKGSSSSSGGTGDFGNSMNKPTTDNTRGTMTMPGEGHVD